MKELSLRQDPDLRKELAQLARGCDFVLPSRFKKRLRAFQQGQAGVYLLVFLKCFCEPVYVGIASWIYCKCKQVGTRLPNFFCDHLCRNLFALVSLLFCLRSCRPCRATCHLRHSVFRREHGPVF